MSAHTQGRLMAGTIYIAIHGEQSEFHCVGIEGTNKAIATTGFVGGDADNSDAISAADARRLAACWNACDMIPTEHVEGFAEAIGTVISTNGKAHIALTAERDQLRAELDMARALMDEALPHINPKAVKMDLARSGPMSEAYINTRVARFLREAPMKGGA